MANQGFPGKMKDRRQNYSTDYACIFGVFEQMKNQLIKLTDAF